MPSVSGTTVSAMNAASPTSPRRSIRVLTLLAALVALTVLIAGCGSSSSSGNGIDSKSASEIVAASKQAVTGATSVHVAGSVVNEGKTIDIDLQLATGKGAAGSLTIDGQPIEIVEVGDSFYLRASESFYRQIGGAAAATLLKGKWLRAPLGSGEFASLSALTNLEKLLGGTLSGHGSLSKTASTTINGQSAIGVSDNSQGTLYVATTGPAYPVAIVKAGANGGKIVFDKWNQPVALKAPAGAVNLTDLQG